MHRVSSVEVEPVSFSRYEARILLTDGRSFSVATSESKSVARNKAEYEAMKLDAQLETVELLREAAASRRNTRNG